MSQLKDFAYKINGFGKTKLALIFLLGALTVYQTGQLWFENLANRNVFVHLMHIIAPPVPEGYFSKYIARPFRVAFGRGDGTFGVRYVSLPRNSLVGFDSMDFDNEALVFGDEAMLAVLSRGIFIGEAVIDYNRIFGHSHPMMIFEYAFPMCTEVFSEAFGQSSGGALLNHGPDSFFSVAFHLPYSISVEDEESFVSDEHNVYETGDSLLRVFFMDRNRAWEFVVDDSFPYIDIPSIPPWNLRFSSAAIKRAAREHDDMERSELERMTIERAIAEERRAVAEEESAIAEERRAIAEEERAIAETERAMTEEERAIAEIQRILAEEARILAEEDRIRSEETRARAEEARKIAEDSAREREERDRQTIEGLNNLPLNALIAPFSLGHVHRPIRLVNPYATDFGELQLGFIRNRVAGFFDNPATINQDLVGADRIFTFFNTTTVVRYYPSDIVEYNSFRRPMTRANSSHLLTDFSAALAFVMNDSHVINDFFLAGYQAVGREHVFWFNYVVGNYPLAIPGGWPLVADANQSAALSNPWDVDLGATGRIPQLLHPIEVIVEHGRVVRYRKLAFNFEIVDTLAAQLAGKEMDGIRIDFLESIEEPARAVLLGYRVNRDSLGHLYRDVMVLDWFYFPDIFDPFVEEENLYAMGTD